MPTVLDVSSQQSLSGVGGSGAATRERDATLRTSTSLGQVGQQTAEKHDLTPRRLRSLDEDKNFLVPMVSRKSWVATGSA